MKQPTFKVMIFIYGIFASVAAPVAGVHGRNFLCVAILAPVLIGIALMFARERWLKLQEAPPAEPRKLKIVREPSVWEAENKLDGTRMNIMGVDYGTDPPTVVTYSRTPDFKLIVVGDTTGQYTKEYIRQAMKSRFSVALAAGVDELSAIEQVKEEYAKLIKTLNTKIDFPPISDEYLMSLLIETKCARRRL